MSVDASLVSDDDMLQAPGLDHLRTQGLAVLAQRRLQSAFGTWAALASSSFAERARQLRALRAAVAFEAGWRLRRALDCWRAHAEGSRTRRQLLQRAAARLNARRCAHLRLRKPLT